MFSLSFGTHPLQRSQPAKRIVYGSSDLVSAKEFLQQVRWFVCMYICTGTCGASPAFLQQSPPLGVLQSFSCFFSTAVKVGRETSVIERTGCDKSLTVLLYWNIENSTHKVLRYCTSYKMIYSHFNHNFRGSAESGYSCDSMLVTSLRA